MSEKILELTKSFPTSFGVYIMKDQVEKPIYIGKAKNLKSRVRSYFSKDKGDRLQIPYLVSEVESVDYLITKTESEALLVENSLIKRHKPKYNIRLKDDKTYSSLRLSVHEEFARLNFTRRIKEDGALYFGPFASGESLKQTSRLVRKLFPIRDCSDEKFRRHKQRPCLSYYIKLCSGPCAKKVSKERYNEIVDQAATFLRGDRAGLARIIKESMKKASDEMRYEDAAYYRDQLKYVEKNVEVDKLMSSSMLDKDIIGFYKDKENYEFTILLSRDGAIVDKSDFSVKSFNTSSEEVLREFLGRFYFSERYIPKEVLLPIDVYDADSYSEWLTEKRGKKVDVISPKRGEKLKLIQLAMKNAAESFIRKQNERKRETSLLESLKKSLSLKQVPNTIECFDISNIQGSEPVASLVRFKDGKSDKSRYRRYKIKTVSGPDDFASMYEVIFRRCLRSDQKGWNLPDLILIDGGKGQLNVAMNALKDCGVDDKIDLASIAKSRKKGAVDKIYLPGKKEPIIMDIDKKGIYLLMRIRDEAHRFAITYHKDLRGKKTLKSQIDSIPGIGKKRKLELLNHFGSIEKIKMATVEEISAVKGMNKKVAENIKEAL